MQKPIRILLQSLLISSIFMLNCAFAATVTLPRTGQTSCYDSAAAIPCSTAGGQDGQIRKGAAWPAPRFTDNADGTVTDNLTGLIWLKNANCFNTQIWSVALTSANSLATGTCGLTDGSTVGQWRLPNVTELESLVDMERTSPALPSGHPFTSVQINSYWSSSNKPFGAWYVVMSDGEVRTDLKSNTYYVWPVKAGI